MKRIGRMAGKRYPLKRPVAVDFFSGAGGMSLGFEQAGFDIALSVDKDGYHVATHARNFPYGKSICASVTGLSGATVLQITGRTEVDLVFGGPPCQGFSSMGARDSEDPRNSLVYHFARLIGEIGPKAFVMENVPGMQLGATRAIFEKFIEEIERAGYKVTWPIRTLVASNFGVPQIRERLFVLGLRNDLNRKLEYPDGAPVGQPERPTVAQALEGLPNVDSDDAFVTQDIARYPDSAPRHPYARAAIGLDIDPSDLSLPRIWDRSELRGCKRTKHGAKVTELYAATQPGRMVPGHKLPRLNPDGLAPTLRAGTDSERGSHTAPRPIHPYSPRVITVREAARIHGYPDWFTFYPNSFHSYRQIGNSVCPPVARAVGLKILEALGVRLGSRQPNPVALANEYVLPKETEKAHKRLTQLVEFTKVVDYLFSQSPLTNRARTKCSIEVAQIEDAIEKTGAQLPRIRPERFLDDLARSRNVQKILTNVLKVGYSIRKLVGGRGEFVEIDDQGSIHIKKGVSPSSADILASTEAGEIAHASPIWRDIIQSAANSATLFGKWKVKVREERDLFGELKSPTNFYVAEGKVSHLGLAVIWEKRAAPTLEALTNEASAVGATFVLLEQKITNHHIFMATFRLIGDRLEEVARRVYRLSETAASLPLKTHGILGAS